MVLQSEMSAIAILVQMRFEIFDGEIPTDVPVEFAIYLAARISDLGAPDLLARFNVACKHGDSVRAKDWCVNAIPRAGIAIQDGVRVGNEIFDPGIFQERFDTGLVRAFRQPNASRLAA